MKIYMCIIICTIICTFICIGLYLHFKRKLFLQSLQEKEQLSKKYRQEISEELSAFKEEELKKINSDISAADAKLSDTTKQLAKIIEKTTQAQEQLNNMIASSKRSIVEDLALYNKEQISLSFQKIQEATRYEEQCAKEEIAQRIQEYEEQSQQARQTLRILEETIADFQKKQEAINDEIMRQRRIQEDANYYCINISDESKLDIELLFEVRKKLNKSEILDKIIYDNYIAKPTLEMLKRVLGNESYSGIYKITCLTTKEVYIGKSTDVRARWTQHVKTAFNCGTIASSLLHTRMKEKGVENFTFELLEEVAKDQLSDREKYWIEFYQTKKYGLNERKG